MKIILISRDHKQDYYVSLSPGQQVIIDFLEGNAGKMNREKLQFKFLSRFGFDMKDSFNRAIEGLKNKKIVTER